MTLFTYASDVHRMTG